MNLPLLLSHGLNLHVFPLAFKCLIKDARQTTRDESQERLNMFNHGASKEGIAKKVSKKWRDGKNLPLKKFLSRQIF